MNARPPATAPIANSAAANEIHPTKTRFGCRRGGGLTGVRLLTRLTLGCVVRFGASGTSTRTVAASVDSPLAGPAARDARRRARCVVSVTTGPLERPRIEHEVHPILGAGCALGALVAGRENTSAARRVDEGSGALVVGGIRRTAGLRLRARRRPPRLLRSRARRRRIDPLRRWRRRAPLRRRDP